MTEEEFHRARRMFCVKDGTVLVAPLGICDSHIGWLSSIFGVQRAGEMIKHNVRGYVLGERIVTYMGDFNHRVYHEDVICALDVLGAGIKEIGFGAVPGPTQPWEPKILYSIEEYVERMKNYVPVCPT